MKVTQLISNNFRNLKSESIIFSDGINILYGNNAQGKTNIIEAIYLLGTTKSFRKTEENHYINFDSELARLNALVTKENLEKDVRFLFEKNKPKRIFLNGKQVHRPSAYLGSLNVTLFCPEDLMLIKGDASYRRRFMDILFCQTDAAYLSDLLNYQKVMKQRNLVLKDIRDNNAKKELLEPWNIQIASYSKKISIKRHEYVIKLAEFAKKRHLLLINEEELDIIYTDSIYCGQLFDLADYEKDFIYKQKRVQSEEIRKGCTMIGPHRDDLEIKINQINTRVFGSQGQKRSAAISMRMAEVDFIYNMVNEYPVLLLDDIFSELDDKRKKQLMDMLNKDMQIFVTGTEKINLDAQDRVAHIYKINQGKVVLENEHTEKKA